jgi:hypothetical protein
MKKTVITICASSAFYEHVVQIEEQLEQMGYEVLIPVTATNMKKAGTFQLEGFKPPVGDVEWKARLMNGHFDLVEKGDVCLVVNDDKHGVKNYIGGNVLMEMTLAFRKHAPIVIFNDIPQESSFLEEILGMSPIVLNGKIEDLPAKLAAAGLGN